MSILFPSIEFFTSLQGNFNGDAGCVKHLDPSDAYCGLAIGDHLFVLEFDGHECSAVVAGGNTLDLDFVIAAPSVAWQQAIEGIMTSDMDVSLPTLVENGEFEIQSVDDAGFDAARETLPLIQVFLEQARGLDLEFD